VVAVAIVGVIPPTGGVAAAVLGDGGAGETSRKRRGEERGGKGGRTGGEERGGEQGGRTGENRGEQSRGGINTLDPV
jgi:hypothetical protein